MNQSEHATNSTGLGIFWIYAGLLGKALESHIVSVKVGIYGMIHIGNIVFHTEKGEQS